MKPVPELIRRVLDLALRLIEAASRALQGALAWLIPLLIVAWRATRAWTAWAWAGFKRGAVRAYDFLYAGGIVVYDEIAVAIEFLNRRKIGRPLAGTLIFLSLALIGIEADDHVGFVMSALPQEAESAVWTKWLPLALLAFVISVGMTAPDSHARRHRLLLALATASLIVCARLWVAFNGPSPNLSFREATDLFTISLACIAVWLTGRRWPGVVLAAWVGALVVVFMARIFLVRLHFIFRPDLLPVTLSIIWGIVVFGGLSRRAGHRPLFVRVARWDEPYRLNLPARTWGAGPAQGIVPTHMAALGLGLVLGALCLVYARVTAEAAAGQDEVVAGALQNVWLGSVFLGRGRALTLRLLHVLTQPGEIAPPSWLGTTGLMAFAGIAGLLAIGLISLCLTALALRRAHGERLELTSAPQLALLAAQTMAGMIISGGPNSTIPLFALLVWAGIGLSNHPSSTKNGAHEAPPRVTGLRIFTRAFVSTAVLALLGAGTVAAWFPLHSRAIIGGIEDVGEAGVAEDLARAKRLNPWNPRVEVAWAAMLRERMQGRSGWDEGLFEQVCEAYTLAIALDPHDVMPALEMARVQILAERIDEGLLTARRSLVANPFSPELIDWIYITASKHDRDVIALAMVERGLEIRPDALSWWSRRYHNERKAGRPGRARRTLDLVLTSAVGEGADLESAFVRESYIRSQVGIPTQPRDDEETQDEPAG